MTFPSLYAIVDVDVAAREGWTPRDLSRAYLAGGARWLQLRAKSWTGAAFLELAEQMVSDAQAYEAIVVINDRPDIARLAGAAGVHLGQDDLPPEAARPIVGGSEVVGLSTHTKAQIEAAQHAAVTYIAVGPLFGTSTKDTGYEAVGLDLVRVAARTKHVVVGIGGITLDRAESVLRAGAGAVAVISDLLVDGDPEARVRQWLAHLTRISDGRS